MSDAELGWLRQRAWEALLVHGPAWRAAGSGCRRGMCGRTMAGWKSIRTSASSTPSASSSTRSPNSAVSTGRSGGSATPALRCPPTIATRVGVRLTWRLLVYNTLRNILRKALFAVVPDVKDFDCRHQRFLPFFTRAMVT